MERLTFNVGRRTLVVAGRQGATGKARPSAHVEPVPAAGARERYSWDYLWMAAFTWLLFFRPQDQIPPLEVLHLAELTALAGLAAMTVRRLGAGLPVARVNTEVVAIIALGGVIVVGIPFSIWPGGSLKDFTDIYLKVILIFALMMSTLTTPKRIRQLTWLMVVASGYIALRGVIDYARGMNLVEGDRLRGAIGGMFENPNDLALNLVTFLAPTLFLIIEERRASRRIGACVIAALMLLAIVFTKSRSGFLGLVAMGAVVAYYTVRVRPGVLIAVFFAGLLALPAMPQSFWNRMDSIVNGEEDQTGSREARIRLFNQGLQVFADNPLTGIGLGQFKNYIEPGVTQEKWRVTHNVWLQVASELGIFGFAIFAFLVYRAYNAAFVSLRLMRRPRKKLGQSIGAARVAPARAGPSRPVEIPMTPEERRILDLNARSMVAAMVGWTVCSFFASVAFNWTFYYVLALAVAGREVLVSRRAAALAEPEQPAATRTSVRGAGTILTNPAGA